MADWSEWKFIAEAICTLAVLPLVFGCERVRLSESLLFFYIYQLDMRMLLGSMPIKWCPIRCLGIALERSKGIAQETISPYAPRSKSKDFIISAVHSHNADRCPIILELIRLKSHKREMVIANKHFAVTDYLVHDLFQLHLFRKIAYECSQ